VIIDIFFVGFYSGTSDEEKEVKEKGKEIICVLVCT
jgi:hypothetical protein